MLKILYLKNRFAACAIVYCHASNLRFLGNRFWIFARFQVKSFVQMTTEDKTYAFLLRLLALDTWMENYFTIK